MRRLPKFLLWTCVLLGVLVLALALLWLARARLAAQVAQTYFRQHGIAASIQIGALGLSGISGQIQLGSPTAPEFSADRVEVAFDPLIWTPRIVEVRLIHPVIRLGIDAQGHITLGSLQHWVQSLQDGGGKSQFVSDDLAVVLTNLQALVASPAGNLTLQGDVRLEKNLPVTADLRLQPGRFAYQGHMLHLTAAQLSFRALPQGDGIRLHLEGDYAGAVKTGALKADVSADGLRWDNNGGFHAVLPLLHLTGDMAAIQVGSLAAQNVKIDLTAQDAAVQGGDFKAGLRIHGSASTPQAGRMLLTSFPVLARDPALTGALVRALSGFDLALAADVSRHANVLHAALRGPLLLKTARGAILRVPVFAADGTASNLQGLLQASLSGGGLPATDLASSRFTWSEGALSADLTLKSRFSFDMLHDVSAAIAGDMQYANAMFAFSLRGCAPVRVQTVHAAAHDLAHGLSGTVCATGATPLLSVDRNGWTVAAAARGIATTLPQAGVRVGNASGTIAFSGKSNASPAGVILLTGATLDDAIAAPRFHALNGTGRITLQGNAWHGVIAVTQKTQALGEVRFTHDMIKSTGSAHIAAPGVTFTDGKFQPADISPLLAAFKHADGKAGFDGDIGWSPSGFTSHGMLDIGDFDFLTPLGRAHSLKTHLELTSLLPPATAKDQQITLGRIDWTLPLSSTELHFALAPATLDIASASTAIADGKVRLGALAVNLAAPGRVEGAADLSGVSLSQLVDASNLGSRLKLDGKVSGHIPFSIGPEGFRITNGHIASDGPGRISIDRSLWTQGAPAANAVQDFAYQALEYLAYDSLTADVNSVSNGRLQLLFHIKGRSDPPKPQTADIAVSDIINGTALSHPVPLPSATPIDLTLDSSLNFDELLKSYAEAWSKVLQPTQ